MTDRDLKVPFGARISPATKQALEEIAADDPTLRSASALASRVLEEYVDDFYAEAAKKRKKK